MSGLSPVSGTSARAMADTAAAAWTIAWRLIRFRPLMSTIDGIMVMSFGPTNAVTSPPAMVETMTLGTPIGRVLMAAVAIVVPALPPRLTTASSHGGHRPAPIPGQCLDPFPRCVRYLVASHVRVERRGPEYPEVDNERVTTVRPYLFREESGFDSFRIQCAHD